MTRRRAAIACGLTLLLCACDAADSREAHRAEQRLAMVKAQGGSKDEVCAASRAVADAWLKALDQNRYAAAKLRADLDCNAAALDRLTA